MKLSIKIFVISLFLFAGLSASAWTNDYISAFKPMKRSQGMSGLERDIKKDIFQIRSMISSKEKELIGLMQDRENTQNARVPSTRAPADI